MLRHALLSLVLSFHPFASAAAQDAAPNSASPESQSAMTEAEKAESRNARKIVVAVIQGRIMSYNGRDNLEDLNITIPAALGRSKSEVEVVPFSLTKLNKEGFKTTSGEIQSAHPDIIIIHLSAFPIPDRQKYCSVTVSDRDCAIDLMEYLSGTTDKEGDLSRIVIYTRKPNICFPGTLDGFRNEIKKSTKGGQVLGLTPLSGIMGFMALTPDNDVSDFNPEGNAPDRLQRVFNALNCPERKTLSEGDVGDGRCLLSEPPVGGQCWLYAVRPVVEGAGATDD